jgi:hypothetical protein
VAKRNTGSAASALRERLAQEAARLIIEHGMEDYGQAKRKAAARLGVTDAGVLPSNTQIEASLAERQRIFEPDTHPLRLQSLRELAAQLMQALSPFQPRLVGPVLSGTATINTAIELHLFTDSPENVALVLERRGIGFREYQRRYRFDNKKVTVIPGFSFSVAGARVYAITFPEKGLRQAPLSPVDQRPMRRAGRAQVLALLND